MAKAFGRALRGSSTVVALLSGIALPVLAVLTPTLYGSSYIGVEPVVLAIGVANGFLVVGAPVSAFVMARLSASRVLTASVIALAVDVVLALGLIPLWGVWGAVVANVGAATTQMLILLVSELTALHLSWAAVGRDTVPVFIGAVVALLAWYASTFVPSVWWAAAVAAVIGVVGVVGLLRVGRSGLTAGDLGAVVRVLPERVRGPCRRDLAERQVARRSGRVTPSSTRSTAAAVSAQRNRSALARPRAAQPSRSTSTDSRAARSDSWSSGSK